VLNEPDEFPASMVNSLFRAKQIRCSVQNRESSAGHWNCSANGESVEMVGNFKNSLLFSQGKGAPRRHRRSRAGALASALSAKESFPCMTRRTKPLASHPTGKSAR
jgi:hypothetical protein